MHKTLRLVALSGVVLLLAACQSAPEENVGEQGCVPTASGNSSDAVEVDGDILSLPAIDFEGTLAPDGTERTVVDAGDGRIAGPGSLVTFAYAAFNGSSGDIIDSVGYETPYSQATLDATAMLPGLEKTLLCSTAGSRVLAVIPPSDAFGEKGNEQYGIEGDDSIVFVIDVVAVAVDRADGEDQPPVEGLPEVHVGPTGEPEITIPPHTPPAAQQTAVLKRGDGEAVTEGAIVTIEYRGVVWASGQTFDSSWTRDALVQLPTSSFIPGFGTALVGQTVGSQVLTTIPPSLGYGSDGNPSAGISGTDTLVFVIDILAVVQPVTAASQE